MNTTTRLRIVAILPAMLLAWTAAASSGFAQVRGPLPASLTPTQLPQEGQTQQGLSPQPQTPQAQLPPGQSTISEPRYDVPQVLHIHNHYYNTPNDPSAQMSTFYAPMYAWKYGWQPGMGTVVEPWKENWGGLGLFGYLGQQQGHTGLVVDHILPGSPAASMGLVRGDFILAIDGNPLDSYKQTAILLEEAGVGRNTRLVLDVWNPHTGRRADIVASVKRDETEREAFGDYER